MCKKDIKVSKINGINIANLTAHDVTFLFNNNKLHNITVNIPCSGFTIRVQEREEIKGEIGGIKIIEKTYTGVTKEDIKAVEELADKVDVIIVSKLAGKYLSPLVSEEALKKIFFIGSTVKDESGKPIGANAISPIYIL